VCACSALLVCATHATVLEVGVVYCLCSCVCVCSALFVCAMHATVLLEVGVVYCLCSCVCACSALFVCAMHATVLEVGCPPQALAHIISFFFFPYDAGLGRNGMTGAWGSPSARGLAKMTAGFDWRSSKRARDKGEVQQG